jgi:hypothetical protein
MFTKKQIGQELKNMIQQKKSIEAIGSWAYSMSLKNIEDADSKFNKLLLDLGTMELGPEFEYSYQELTIIADKIIAGEDVIL